jgi:hypothetical protein
LAHWQVDDAPLTESTFYSFPVTGDRELTAVFEPCPAERLLGPDAVGVEAVYETCHALVAGTGFRVTAPGGDVTFRAGERVILSDGFAVDSGASFRAVVDPQLAAAD